MPSPRHFTTALRIAASSACSPGELNGVMSQDEPLKMRAHTVLRHDHCVGPRRRVEVAFTRHCGTAGTRARMRRNATNRNATMRQSSQGHRGEGSRRAV